MYKFFEETYNPKNAQWLVMGDFNCQADKIGDLDNLGEGNYLFSQSATHESGKIFDFAIKSKLLANIEVKVGMPKAPNYVPISSDHFPIYCSI